MRNVYVQYNRKAMEILNSNCVERAFLSNSVERIRLVGNGRAMFRSSILQYCTSRKSNSSVIAKQFEAELK